LAESETGLKPAAAAKSPSAASLNDNVVFVLGAGVDKCLDLPLVNTLLRDLSVFALGAGKQIDKAIRAHSKPRIDLQTYGGDEAENLGKKLLGTHSHLLPIILAALDKHPDAEGPNVASIKTVMKKLGEIASSNELEEPVVAQLTRLAGDETRGGVTDTVLDTDHISFRPKVRQAIKTILNQVSTEIPDLEQHEKDAFKEVIAILSNFEELLGSLFTGYFTKHIPDQRKYFYLAWLLWAYIRHKEAIGRARRDQSFYKTLSEVGAQGRNIITFNYTDFFDDRTRPANGYFHGDCKAFIKFDSRQYVNDSVQVRDATTLERMEAFIKELEIDWTTDPPTLSLPAIVPPLAMKPIICMEYLDRWYQCSQTIRRATAVVILGYSFGVADEHFNDLIRKGNATAKLVVVNPDMDGTATRLCQTLRQDKAILRSAEIHGLETLSGGRLTFVRAKAEEIDRLRLTELLR
jgi:hypothetical protein